jgi:hypothetical protein
MQTNTKRILQVLHVFTWVAFIGICIIWGSFVISFFISLFVNEAGAKDMYKGLNLSGIRDYGTGYYAGMVAMLVLVWWLKSLLLFWLILIFRKINIQNPFTREVSKLIENISLTTLAIGLFSIAANAYSKWLVKRGVAINNINDYIDGATNSLFMAGVIYFIAQVFKRGVEIQSENDLTV